MYTVEFWLDFPFVLFALLSVRRSRQLLKAFSMVFFFFLILPPHIFSFFFPKVCDGSEVRHDQIVGLWFYMCLSFPTERLGFLPSKPRFCYCKYPEGQTRDEPTWSRRYCFLSTSALEGPTFQGAVRGRANHSCLYPVHRITS